MAVIDDGSTKVWQRILNDQPSVIVGALEGAIAAWPGYSAEAKKRISESLLMALPTRRTWSRLCERWLRSMPTLTMKQPWIHPDGSCGRACSGLSKCLAKSPFRAVVRFEDLLSRSNRCTLHGAQTLLPVCIAWLNAIEEILQKSLPTEEALAIGDLLLPMLGGGSQEGLALIRRLLEHRDTGFTCVSLKCVLKRWRHLGGTNIALWSDC